MKSNSVICGQLYKRNNCIVFALLLLGLWTCCVHAANAQLQTKHWYFGFNAGLVFENDVPRADTNGALVSGENCTAYSDPCTGELMLYTNGESIWGSDHQFIENGQGLLGSVTTTQGVLLLPVPGLPNRICFFAAGGSSSSPQYHNPILSVSVLDNNGSNDSWRVWIKNIPVLDSVSEKVAATQTCDGEGYWVLTHHLRLNTFYLLRLDQRGDYR